MSFEEKRDAKVYWIVIVALLLLTRLVAAAHFLSIDNVNLAFSLEDFDPLNHQPQPPGYPFFVLFARVTNLLFPSVEYTFLFISILTTGLCLPLISALGRRMFSTWAGRAAAMLLLVNPVFWQTGADSPLRVYLAFFSLLIAYCSWRSWNGERRYLFWGAIALGVGSGFRPELLPYLFPLWLISAWIGTRSFKDVALGTAVIAAIVLIWVGALTLAVGGIGPLTKLMFGYLVEQSRGESPIMGADRRGWLRQMSRVVVWNGLATVWWIWAIPVFLRAKTRLTLDKRAIIFIVAWLAPGLCQAAAIHVAAPGHTLFSIPALCLVGAQVLYVAAREFSSSETGFVQIRETVFAAALVFNAMVFLNFFPVPASAAAGGSPSLTNAVAFATHETSLAMLRSMDQVAFLTLKEIRELTPSDRRTIFVSTDVHTGQWFMNWRILRFYEPHRDIWVVADQTEPRTALRVRRYESLQSQTGHPKIPVPRGGRILWILDRTAPFYDELRSVCAVSGGQYVYYTDLAVDALPFSIRGFEFVPQ